MNDKDKLIKERMALFGGAAVKGVLNRYTDEGGKIRLPPEAGTTRKERRELARQLQKLAKK